MDNDHSQKTRTITASIAIIAIVAALGLLGAVGDNNSYYSPTTTSRSQRVPTGSSVQRFTRTMLPSLVVEENSTHTHTYSDIYANKNNQSPFFLLFCCLFFVEIEALRLASFSAFSFSCNRCTVTIICLTCEMQLLNCS
jgi:hypothetical protein